MMMLEMLFNSALQNIETGSLRIMAREFEEIRAASADQRRPGLPVFYCLLLDIVTGELDSREVNGGEGNL